MTDRGARGSEWQRAPCVHAARAQRTQRTGKVSAYDTALHSVATASKRRLAAAPSCTAPRARMRHRRAPARACAPFSPFNDVHQQQEALSHVQRTKRRRAAPPCSLASLAPSPKKCACVRKSAHLHPRPHDAPCANATRRRPTYTCSAPAHASASQYTACASLCRARACRAHARACSAPRRAQAPQLRLRKDNDAGRCGAQARLAAAHQRARPDGVLGFHAACGAFRRVRARVFLTPSTSAHAHWPCRTRAPRARHVPRACARLELVERARGSPALKPSAEGRR
jgi:hypothetical protein